LGIGCVIIEQYERRTTKEASLSGLLVLPVLQREPVQYVPPLRLQEKGESGEGQKGQDPPPAFSKLLSIFPGNLLPAKLMR